MKNKAQISAEYIIIIALVLLILLPIFYHAMVVAGTGTIVDAIQRDLDELTRTADEARILGPGTRDYSYVTIPASVFNTSVDEHEVFVQFEYNGIKTASSVSESYLVGKLPMEPGVHRVSIEVLVSGKVRIGEIGLLIDPRGFSIAALHGSNVSEDFTLYNYNDHTVTDAYIGFTGLWNWAFVDNLSTVIPSSGQDTFNVTFDIPANQSSGGYYGIMFANSTTGDYDEVMAIINVMPEPTYANIYFYSDYRCTSPDPVVHIDGTLYFKVEVKEQAKKWTQTDMHAIVYNEKDVEFYEFFENRTYGFGEFCGAVQFNSTQNEGEWRVWVNASNDYNHITNESTFIVAEKLIVEITSPENTNYYSEKVPLSFKTNLPTKWCGYSLNGTDNVTLDGVGELIVPYGIHEVTVFCNDTESYVAQSSVNFYRAQCVSVPISFAQDNFSNDVTAELQASDESRAQLAALGPSENWIYSEFNSSYNGTSVAYANISVQHYEAHASITATVEEWYDYEWTAICVLPDRVGINSEAIDSCAIPNLVGLSRANSFPLRIYYNATAAKKDAWVNYQLLQFCYI